MHNSKTNKFFILLCLLVLFSCSSYEPFVTPADFDKKEYISPEKYNHDLNIRTTKVPDKKRETNFKPISLTNGYENARSKINTTDYIRRNRIEGEVVIRVYINEKGLLQNIKTIQSPHKTLARITRQAAIEDWEYTPATLNGKPIKSFIDIPAEFEFYEVKQQRRVNNY